MVQVPVVHSGFVTQVLFVALSQHAGPEHVPPSFRQHVVVKGSPLVQVPVVHTEQFEPPIVGIGVPTHGQSAEQVVQLSEDSQISLGQ